MTCPAAMTAESAPQVVQGGLGVQDGAHGRDDRVARGNVRGSSGSGACDAAATPRSYTHRPGRSRGGITPGEFVSRASAALLHGRPPPRSPHLRHRVGEVSRPGSVHQREPQARRGDVILQVRIEPDGPALLQSGGAGIEPVGFAQRRAAGAGGRTEQDERRGESAHGRAAGGSPRGGECRDQASRVPRAVSKRPPGFPARRGPGVSGK